MTEIVDATSRKSLVGTCRNESNAPELSKMMSNNGENNNDNNNNDASVLSAYPEDFSNGHDHIVTDNNISHGKFKYIQNNGDNNDDNGTEATDEDEFDTVDDVSEDGEVDPALTTPDDAFDPFDDANLGNGNVDIAEPGEDDDDDNHVDNQEDSEMIIDEDAGEDNPIIEPAAGEMLAGNDALSINDPFDIHDNNRQDNIERLVSNNGAGDNTEVDEVNAMDGDGLDSEYPLLDQPTTRTDQQQNDLLKLEVPSSADACLSTKELTNTITPTSNNYTSLILNHFSMLNGSHHSLDLGLANDHLLSPKSNLDAGEDFMLSPMSPGGRSKMGNSTGNAPPPILCGTCGALIRHRQNVAAHMRRHLGYKPYACTLCGHAGFDESDVRRHVARQHGHSPDTPVSATTVRYQPEPESEAALGELVQGCRAAPSDDAAAALSPTGAFDNIVHSQEDTKATSSEPDFLFHPTQFDCALCWESVPNDQVLIVQHLVTQHLSFNGYSCILCAQAQPTESTSDATKSPQNDINNNRQQATSVEGKLVAAQQRFWRYSDLQSHILKHHRDSPSDPKQQLSAGQKSTNPVTRAAALRLALESLPSRLIALATSAFANPLYQKQVRTEQHEQQKRDTLSLGRKNGHHKSLKSKGKPDNSTAAAGVALPQLRCELCAKYESSSPLVPFAPLSIWRHVDQHQASSSSVSALRSYRHRPLMCIYCKQQFVSSTSNVQNGAYQRQQQLSTAAATTIIASAALVRHIRTEHPGSQVVLAFDPDYGGPCIDNGASTGVSVVEDAVAGVLEGKETGDTSNLKKYEHLSRINVLSACFPLLATQLLEKLLLEPKGASANEIRKMVATATNALHASSNRSKLAPTNNGMLSETVICRMCGSNISSSATIMMDHAKRHLNYRCYQCDTCDSDSELNQPHVNNDHNPSSAKFTHFLPTKMAAHHITTHSDVGVMMFTKLLGEFSTPKAASQATTRRIREMAARCFGIGLPPNLVTQDLARKDAELARVMQASEDSAEAANQYGDENEQPSSKRARLNEAEQVNGSQVNATENLPPVNPEVLKAFMASAGIDSDDVDIQDASPVTVGEPLMYRGPGRRPAYLTTGMVPNIGMSKLNQVSLEALKSEHEAALANSTTNYNIASLPSLVAINQMGGASGTPTSTATAAETECADMTSLAAASVGKRICTLCSTYIACNASSFEIHACKHMDYKPFHCHYCIYQSYIRGKVTRHIQQVHHGLPMKINYEPIAGIKDQIVAFKKACFPPPNKPNSNTEMPQKGGEIVCRICSADALEADANKDVTTETERPDSKNDDAKSVDTKPQLVKVSADQISLDAHLASHIPSGQRHWVCPACPASDDYSVKSEKKARQHVANAHADLKVTRVLCCPLNAAADNDPETQLSPEDVREQLRVSCFGPRLTAEEIRGTTFYGSAAQEPEEEAVKDAPNNSPTKDETVDEVEAEVPTPIQEEDMETEDTTTTDDLQVAQDKVELPKTTTDNAMLEEKLQQHRVMSAMSGRADASIVCNTCNLPILTLSVTALKGHVRRHIATQLRPYRCGHCTSYAGGVSEPEVKRHIAEKHSDLPLTVSYSPPDCDQLAHWQLECFPSIFGIGPHTFENPDIAEPSAGADMTSVILQQQAAEGATTPRQTSDAVRQLIPSPQQQLQRQQPAASPTSSSPSFSTSQLRKLVCQICQQPVADNPKSIGIHVKNHLNYRPYRCPECRYASCEQSKARRHIEHVHGRPGIDLIIEPQAAAVGPDSSVLDATKSPPTIKERITAMKAKCFPTLGHVALHDVYAASVATTAPASDAADFDLKSVTSSAITPPPSQTAQSNNQGFGIGAGPTSISRNKMSTLDNAIRAASISNTHNAISTLPWMNNDLRDNGNNGRFETSNASFVSTNVDFSQDHTGGDVTNQVCAVCSTAVPPESIDYHVRSHIGKPYKCAYCASARFESATAAEAHHKIVHPGSSLRVSFNQSVITAALGSAAASTLASIAKGANGTPDPKLVFAAVKRRCFTTGGNSDDECADDGTGFGASTAPGSLDSNNDNELFGINDSAGMDDEDDADSTSSSLARLYSATSPASLRSLAGIAEPAKVTCGLCDALVAANAPSLDVHIKNHLGFKPYRCGYCDYRSCVPGKVKRHLDTVHRGLPTKSMNTAQGCGSIPGVKAIFQQLKKVCFPGLAYLTNSLANGVEPEKAQQQQQQSQQPQMSKPELVSVVERLKQALRDQLRQNALAKQNGIRARQNRFQQQPGPRPNLALGSDSIRGSQPNVDLNQLLQAGKDGSGSLGGLFGKGSTDLANLLPFLQQKQSDNGNLSDTDSLLDAETLNDTTDASDGTVNCAQCHSDVLNSRLALGVHARNHLGYKPYHCQFCEYHSTILAKMRSHLMEEHKFDAGVGSLGWNYKAQPDVQARSGLMKARCFPNNPLVIPGIPRSQADISPQAAELRERKQQLEARRQQFMRRQQQQQQQHDNFKSSHNSVMDEATAAIDAAAQQAEQSLAFATGGSSGTDSELVGGLAGLGGGDLAATMSLLRRACAICWSVVFEPGMDAAQRRAAGVAHSRTHLSRRHYRCGCNTVGTACAFLAADPSYVEEHMRQEHPEQMATATVLDVPPGPVNQGSVNEWLKKCFPNIDTDESDNLSTPPNGVSGNASTAESRIDDIVASVNNGSSRQTSSLQHLIQKRQQALSEQHRKEATQPPLQVDMEYPHARRLQSPAVAAAMSNRKPAGANAAAGTPQANFNSVGTGANREVSRHICQLCNNPVSTYASSLYTHVKNHMNYKPYACTYCAYRSPVKAKVRRHSANSHRGLALRVDYFPRPGVEREIAELKRRCFPDAITSTTGSPPGGNASTAGSDSGNVSPVPPTSPGNSLAGLDLDPASLIATTAASGNLPVNDKIPCELCQVEVANAFLSRSVHAKNHLDARPYHCEYCEYRSCLKGETRRHISRQHPSVLTPQSDSNTGIIYVEAEDVAQADVSAMIATCFPNSPTIPDAPEISPATSMANNSAIAAAAMQRFLAAATSQSGMTASGSRSLEQTCRDWIAAGIGKNGGQSGALGTNNNDEDEDEVDVDGSEGQIASPASSIATSVADWTAQLQALTSKAQSQIKTSIASPDLFTSPATSNGFGSSISGPSTNGSSAVKLATAHPVWHCLYCDSFRAPSKYHVKQHCLTAHPGCVADATKSTHYAGKGAILPGINEELHNLVRQQGF